MSQLSAEDEAELQSLLKQLLRSINDRISGAPSTECAEEILLHLEETDKNFHNYELVKYLRQYVESSLGTVVEQETNYLTRGDGQHAIGSGHDTLIHAITRKSRDSAEYQQMMQTLKNTMIMVVESLINKFEEDQMRKEEMHREQQHSQANSQYTDNCSDSDSSFNQSYAFIRQEQLQVLAEQLDSSRPKEHGYYSRTVVLRLLERKYKSLSAERQEPGSVQRSVYTGKEIEYAFFVHSLCVLGKLLIYTNGRKLFPITVKKRKGTRSLSAVCVRGAGRLHHTRLLHAATTTRDAERSGSKYGFNMVMSHPHAVNEIALSLNNRNPRTKALVLELLAAVCLVRGGHEIILSAFDNFKTVCSESMRFEKLMEHFKNEDDNIDFLVACMQFINIVVHSVEDMNFRVHLQYDFTKLNLDEHLERLKHTESDRLQVQIQAYLDNVFDVGTLLEDAETKTAALERVEELEENLGTMSARVLDVENEAMLKIVELEKQLMQTNKELDQIRDVYASSNSQVHTLRRIVREKDQTIRRQSRLERQAQEAQQAGGPGAPQPPRGEGDGGVGDSASPSPPPCPNLSPSPETVAYHSMAPGMGGATGMLAPPPPPMPGTVSNGVSVSTKMLSK
ncbi:inverted formin-2-like [Notothenia coriiceps]|uniref:Inverted formin-2-like n=1 Tax=Notothenia coriiceps TaxID=8208 RepID=A0A6I9PVP1_9TELE|nr:PREDICTED: inverted formin-2-like [Notothenia coriiceps]